jgi:hypothetical protein
VQRNKSFLVVCVSILITAIAVAQDVPSIHPAASGPGAILPPSGTFEGSALPGHLTLTSPILARGLWIDRAVAFPPSAAAFALPFTTASANSHPGLSVSPAGSPPSTSLADDYYSRHFGFFCKRELELEKTIHVPVRFRLGSLENCNRLEGK